MIPSICPGLSSDEIYLGLDSLPLLRNDESEKNDRGAAKVLQFKYTITNKDHEFNRRTN